MIQDDSSLSRLDILVIEDHAFQRGVLVDQLRAIGVRRIREAPNGREALGLLDGGDRQVTPDVIVCDLEMPEMDGVEFLRVVAERRMARGVIILSGHDPGVLRSVGAMAAASGLNVLGRAAKPVSVERLRMLLLRDLEPPRTARLRAPPSGATLDPAALRAALDALEFRAVFQPKVRLSDGNLVGAEALARWVRPGAPVPPLEFVPAIARAGLMTPLTELMLDEACGALAAWDSAGLRPGVSVNVSMETLADLRTADRFAARVSGHGIVPDRITLEVTETEVMTDLVPVLNVLSRLRLKGFKLSIDDFGTGYSSLAQLNTIPFTELKIDRSFVHSGQASRRLRTIVRTSIGLARRLGIRSVAEGVETADEWDFLRRSGCDEAQGYLIARPMFAADLPNWVSRWQPPG